MGRVCHCCGRERANERFSGGGHKRGICKDCQKLPAEERERRYLLDHVENMVLFQKRISEKNISTLERCLDHADTELAARAWLALRIARAAPFRKHRWKRIRESAPELYRESIAAYWVVENDCLIEPEFGEIPF